MSAWIVSHDHIDALLTAAKLWRMQDDLAFRFYEDGAPRFTDWTVIGRKLLEENVRSVRYRYNDNGPEMDLPGKWGTVESYQFRTFEPFIHMQPTKLCVWVIKACDCYNYQACETPDYKTTVAYKIIDNIRDKAMCNLPHYDAAPWGIDRDRIKDGTAA
jgi:hypothetical protein